MENAINAEKIKILIRQTPIVLTANVIIGVGTVIVMLPVASRTIVASWIVLILLLNSSRFAGWVWLKRQAVHPPARLTGLLNAPASALSGVLWGGGAALMFPDTVLHQVFLAFVVGGMCAGAVVSLSSYLPSLVAFLFPATMLLATRFALENSPTGFTMAGMIVVFAAALTLAGLHLNQSLTENLRLRFELDRANIRLRAEMAQRETAERTLHQAQKMDAIGQLTGGIAHDFNNILTAVVGNLELILSRSPTSDPRHRMAQSALRAADRGIRLVQHLLAFARQQKLSPELVNIKMAFTDMLVLCRQAAGEAMDLSVDAPGELWPCLLDPVQLESAILNLIINARDAALKGGRISLSAHNMQVGSGDVMDLPAGDYVRVSVRDDGAGMSPEDMARAFEPFFSTKEMGKGTGLGLAMVYGFARQSGGTAVIESAPGQGTAVHLYLPRATSVADGKQHSIGGRSEAGGN